MSLSQLILDLKCGSTLVEGATFHLNILVVNKAVLCIWNFHSPANLMFNSRSSCKQWVLERHQSWTTTAVKLPKIVDILLASVVKKTWMIFMFLLLYTSLDFGSLDKTNNYLMVRQGVSNHDTINGNIDIGTHREKDSPWIWSEKSPSQCLIKIDIIRYIVLVVFKQQNDPNTTQRVKGQTTGWQVGNSRRVRSPGTGQANKELKVRRVGQGRVKREERIRS